MPSSHTTMPMSRPFLVVTMTALLAGAVVAQSRTFIVDNQNGPGTTHTGLQDALDASRDGDRILVRASAQPYGSATREIEVRTAVEVIGLPESGGSMRRPVVWGILCEPLPEATVVLAGFDLLQVGASIRATAGRIVLVDIVARAVDAIQADEISLHDCWLTGLSGSSTRVRLVARGTRERAIRVHLQGCVLAALPLVRSGWAGIDARFADVEIVDSFVEGDNGFAPFRDSGPGIRGNGRLTILGRSSVGYSRPATGRERGIDWVGEFALSADSTIVGPSFPAPEPLPTWPVLAAPSTFPLGGTVDLQAFGSPGSAFAVIVSPALARIGLPDSPLPILISVAETPVLWSATLDGSGAASWSALPIPSIAGLENAVLYMQPVELVGAAPLPLRLGARHAVVLR